MSKERLEEIKNKLHEIQELINKSKQEDNGKINEKIINLYLNNHIDWLVQRNERYIEIFKKIINVRNDENFNPYAYMILEIIEWAEGALEGE